MALPRHLKVDDDLNLVLEGQKGPLVMEVHPWSII